MTEQLITTITNLISAGGYPALFVLTLLDSMVLPVPNEAIIPFAGFLVSAGRFSFFGVIVVSIIGGVFGALTSYAIGYYGAAAFIRRFGKYVRLNLDDLNKTQTFFTKYGEKIILVSRFIPLVRQFISIPAGAGKMKLTKFCLYTAIGSALWNSAMTALGYTLGKNWSGIKQYMRYFDMVIMIGAAAFVIYIVFKIKRGRKE